MGKITEALKKVADERISRIENKPEIQYIVKKEEASKIDEHIASFHDSNSPIGEQYKITRTNIQTLKAIKGCNTFLITSALNGEGKTVTAVNLAVTLANDLDRKSVLLIDADMRKGKVAKYLGIKHTPGLSDVLTGNIKVDFVFVNPGIGNLSVIFSGKHSRNPAELLASKKMQRFITEFKNRFDYVLIDSPPVVPLTDACVLGPMTDGVILVVHAGRTQRGVVEHAQNRLHQAGAKALGYIMTNIEYHLPQYLYRYIPEYTTYEYKYEDEKS